jgi:beta-galactosidase beta subunit
VDLLFYKGMLDINFINLKAGMVIMCNKEEMQELIQCFINLPDIAKAA